MLGKKFSKRNSNRIQQATFCFLVRKNHVLLAMKKRGFGVGLWNGVGGKVAEGETVKSAAHREASEEIGIKIVQAKKAALLHFYFPEDPKKKDWNQDVHVFLVTKWMGEPQETEEMRPQWFGVSKIPFEAMWSDDPHWLPKVLAGKRIIGWFSFNDDNKVLDYKVKNVGKGAKISS